MNSYLQTSFRERLTSVGSSLLVHGVVIGFLFVIAKPVWKSSGTRTVITIAAPVPKAKIVPLARLKTPQRDQSPAVELAVSRKPLALPTAVERPRLRIEAPLETAPVQVTPLPALAMPVLAVKPMVKVGLLDTPAATSAPKRLAAGSSGFDSSAPQEKTGGGRQVGGTGFDEAVASGPAKTRQLAAVGFDATEAPTARAAVAKNTPASFEGIEILEKPQPLYTEEARRLRIEGTVRLRVVFGAAGQIRVVSVVQGLGHGLDEAAVQAAEAIRFRPARRDGRPVDAPAVIQIQFQIA